MIGNVNRLKVGQIESDEGGSKMNGNSIKRKAYDCMQICLHKLLLGPIECELLYLACDGVLT